MTKKTEYLVTRCDRNLDEVYQIRVPKGVNLKLLLERLICRELDTDTIVASCLRKNSKRAYDPFQIVDEREDYRRERAKAAMAANPTTDDPIGTFYRAWDAPIPPGKALLFAGVSQQFLVKEVEA